MVKKRNQSKGKSKDNKALKSEKSNTIKVDAALTSKLDTLNLKSSKSSKTKSAGQKKTGIVKRFNVCRGYGFITIDNGEGDAFVHHTDISMKGFTSLAMGEKVEFVLETVSNGKLRAFKVTGPNGAKPKGQDKRAARKKMRKKKSSNKA